MIWYLIIGYIVVSQILVLGLFSLSMFDSDCQQAETLRQSSNQKQILTTMVEMLLGLLFAPILAPILIYFWRQSSKEIGEEIAYWNNVLQNHYELRLEPLHDGNLGEELREYFDEQSAAPMTGNYQLIGDFWMKDEPFNSKSRIFLDSERGTFAEIGNTLELNYCEILSFLDDGTVVSTANCEPLDIQDQLAEHGYHVECHPEMQMAEMLKNHDALLKTVVEKTGVDVRPVPEARWKEYFHYHNRRFGEIKFLIGKATESPADAEFPASDSEQFEMAETVV